MKSKRAQHEKPWHAAMRAAMATPIDGTGRTPEDQLRENIAALTRLRERVRAGASGGDEGETEHPQEER